MTQNIIIPLALLCVPRLSLRQQQRLKRTQNAPPFLLPLRYAHRLPLAFGPRNVSVNAAAAAAPAERSTVKPNTTAATVQGNEAAAAAATAMPPGFAGWWSPLLFVHKVLRFCEALQEVRLQNLTDLGVSIRENRSDRVGGKG